MGRSSVLLQSLESFYEDEWITGPAWVVKSGKEATVYGCEAARSVGMPLLAVKVYRSRANRSFKNDAVYREGRVILDARLRRAVKNKSRAGRAFQFGSWVAHEFSLLSQLHSAGADVPRPFASTEDAILMEYIGTREAPAPQLADISLAPEEAVLVFEQVLRTVDICLSENLVHGDLSAFNILYGEGRIKVIDLPQAVDARRNPSAFRLLARDVENVCAYFADYGVRSQPDRIARDLWTRFLRGSA